MGRAKEHVGAKCQGTHECVARNEEIQLRNELPAEPSRRVRLLATPLAVAGLGDILDRVSARLASSATTLVCTSEVAFRPRPEHKSVGTMEMGFIRIAG